MIWKLIRQNLIKWWYVIYTPIVKKIWPTKEEKKIYEAEHPEEFEKKDISDSPDTICGFTATPDLYQNSSSNKNVDNSLYGNKNYNATTHAMSGDYGKGPLDDDAKAQLDAILKSNYNAVDPISIEAIPQDDEPISVVKEEEALPIPKEEPHTGSDLTQKEEDDAMEQLRQAEEIYERLRREAAEDEARKQAEIEAAKNISS